MAVLWQGKKTMSNWMFKRKKYFLTNVYRLFEKKLTAWKRPNLRLTTHSS